MCVCVLACNAYIRDSIPLPSAFSPTAAVLRDVEALQGQAILFIDEMHVLVGAGKLKEKCARGLTVWAGKKRGKKCFWFDCKAGALSCMCGASFVCLVLTVSFAMFGSDCVPVDVLIKHDAPLASSDT